MVIVKADILGAEDGVSDAAGRPGSTPEAIRDCERGLAEKPPCKLKALAESVTAIGDVPDVRVRRREEK
jgi:hypothetical protein